MLTFSVLWLNVIGILVIQKVLNLCMKGYVELVKYVLYLPTNVLPNNNYSDRGEDTNNYTATITT